MIFKNMFSILSLVLRNWLLLNAFPLICFKVRAKNKCVALKCWQIEEYEEKMSRETVESFGETVETVERGV